MATVAAAAFAPGHGGSFALLGQPGTLDRQVLVPAALTVFFLAVREPAWPLLLSLAALGAEVFLVHASTAVFLGLTLAGYLAARWLLARRDVRSGVLAYASLLVPAGIALAWIAPIVGETAIHAMLTLVEGNYSFKMSVKLGTKNCARKLTAILLDASRDMDEDE